MDAESSTPQASCTTTRSGSPSTSKLNGSVEAPQRCEPASRRARLHCEVRRKKKLELDNLPLSLAHVRLREFHYSARSRLTDCRAQTIKQSGPACVVNNWLRRPFLRKEWRVRRLDRNAVWPRGHAAGPLLPLIKEAKDVRRMHARRERAETVVSVSQPVSRGAC